ncbi:TRAP transporter small permease [Acuticoccus sp. M5D2P5]|uniref:TRAP transporter small permease n=1 Tax=Acuticoccus kalidii TaxID=2910977 RepID=UPI001F477154|nr:TRAP transporter small permease [Acuticoccus kalidii]MCF3933720.1 TRAP transporter small permease [Acuticoccus kalidii]
MDTIRDVVCGLLLAAIFILLNVQILFRYVLDNPLSWPEEIARTCFVWVAYVGVAKLVRERGFYAIDVFVVMLPAPLRHLLAIAVDLLTLGIFALILYASSPVLKANANITTAIGMPVNILYASLPVAAVLVVLSLIVSLVTTGAPETGKEPT